MKEPHNLYEILGVGRQASTDQIKRAYYALIRQNHPDRFSAERRALQAANDQAGLRALDRRLEEAKRRTQSINGAYAILGDAERRARYDRAQTPPRPPQPGSAQWRAAQENVPPRAARRPTAAQVNAQRRAQAQNKAGQPPRPQTQTVPWALLAALLLVLLVAFNGLSGFMSGLLAAPGPTAIGFTANQLPPPESARQATRIARTQTALRPTITPRSAEANLASADALARAGEYEMALELYDRALAQIAPRSELYYQRALVYLALEDQISALDDLDRSLSLDVNLNAAYRERGLIYYQLWQRSGSAEDARAARRDLERYLLQADADDAPVRGVLELLPAQ